MLPKTLVKRIYQFFPQDVEYIFAGWNSERMSSFRVNTLKNSEGTCISELRKAGFAVQKFENIPLAYTLPREEEFRLKGSKFFREGYIYMQSLSSMLPALTLAPKSGEVVLDVCAAPGSKTTQMAVMMENQGRIIALEKSPIRHDILVHNVALQGASNIETIRQDAVQYLKSTDETFDAILLDAPCSAEGRISTQNEKSYGFFSVENIKKKAALQKELLALSISHLRPGGRIVYATCTLAPEENEEVIRDCMAGAIQCDHPSENNPIRIIPVTFPFEEYRSGINLPETARILPSSLFEGFYVACIWRK